MSTLRHAAALLRSQPLVSRAGRSLYAHRNDTESLLRIVKASAAARQLSTGFQTRASKAAAAKAAAAGAEAEGAADAGRRAAPRGPSTASIWASRAMYMVFGAAAAGGAVLFATDPKGTTDAIKDVKHNIEENIRFFTEPSREKLLPDFRPAYPGQPPMRTLVIDLDDTLVHSSYSRSTGWRVAKRPGAEAFLAYLCSFYEIVVFTSKLNMYADPILNSLDPNGYISHRLYRAETKFEKGVYVKDLSVLNRDLDRVVVIDHDMKNCKYHRDNAIEVSLWNGDATDTVLLDLMPFLETLAKEDVADVREHLVMLRGKAIKDAVAEHSANAAARLEKEQEKKGIFFGGAVAPPPPPPAEEDTVKGAVWNTLPKTSKIFHPSTKVEISEDAKKLKDRF